MKKASFFARFLSVLLAASAAAVPVSAKTVNSQERFESFELVSGVQVDSFLADTEASVKAGAASSSLSIGSVYVKEGTDKFENVARTEAGCFASVSGGGAEVMFALSGGTLVRTAGTEPDKASVRAELNDHFVYDTLSNESSFFVAEERLPSLFTADRGLPEPEVFSAEFAKIGERFDGVAFDGMTVDDVAVHTPHGLTERRGYSAMLVSNTDGAPALPGMSRVEDAFFAFTQNGAVLPVGGGLFEASNGTSAEPSCSLLAEFNDHLVYRGLFDVPVYYFPEASFNQTPGILDRTSAVDDAADGGSK